MNERIDVEDYLGLAKKIAWDYAITSGIQLAELVGEAYLALVMAEKGYKPEEGVKFSTYAHGAITNHLNKYMNRISDIRSAEIQMGYLLEMDRSNTEDSETEIPGLVKNTWYDFWFNYRDWSDTFIGIEKDIYELVCRDGIYTKRSLERKLRKMGYKFQEIWDAFASITLQLKSA